MFFYEEHTKKRYSGIWNFSLLSACFFCRVKGGAGGVMASAVVVGRKKQAGGSRPAAVMGYEGMRPDSRKLK